MKFFHVRHMAIMKHLTDPMSCSDWMELGSLLREWKEENFLLAFKKGDRKMALNYGQVSLTTIVRKTLKVVRK